jgi:hypothetical protein
VSVSLYLNMFGYDDDALNGILMAKALDPHITMLITLDESQSKGVHAKKLLDSDIAKNPNAYNTHFVTGTSETHQISHTKGLSRTAEWVAKASPPGRHPAKGRSWLPDRRAARDTRRRTTPRVSSPIPIPSAVSPPS